MRGRVWGRVRRTRPGTRSRALEPRIERAASTSSPTPASSSATSHWRISVAEATPYSKSARVRLAERVGLGERVAAEVAPQVPERAAVRVERCRRGLAIGLELVARHAELRRRRCHRGSGAAGTRGRRRARPRRGSTRARRRATAARVRPSAPRSPAPSSSPVRHGAAGDGGAAALRTAARPALRRRGPRSPVTGAHGTGGRAQTRGPEGAARTPRRPARDLEHAAPLGALHRLGLPVPVGARVLVAHRNKRCAPSYRPEERAGSGGRVGAGAHSVARCRQQPSPQKLPHMWWCSAALASAGAARALPQAPARVVLLYMAYDPSATSAWAPAKTRRARLRRGPKSEDGGRSIHATAHRRVLGRARNQRLALMVRVDGATHL